MVVQAVEAIPRVPPPRCRSTAVWPVVAMPLRACAAFAGSERYTFLGSALGTRPGAPGPFDLAVIPDTEPSPLYGGAAIDREEASRSARQAARDALFHAELVVGRTLRMPLRRFNITYKPADVDHFDSYGSVYHHLKLNAAWGTIVVSHGNVLINRNFSELTVAAPSRRSGATLHGKGWVLKLSPRAKIVADPKRPGSYIIRMRPTAVTK